MTQSVEASREPRAAALSVRTFVVAHAFWLGVVAVAIAASAFLLHQLMAWAPHEDETLALFVGRDSLSGVIEHVTRERGGAPLHFLFAYGVAHLGGGLGSLRLVSAAFAVGSLPLVALLGRRVADRSTALIATALVAGSWVFLFHGVYARMYSIFLFLSLLSFVLLLRALDRGNWPAWTLWGVAVLLTVAAHPYGALVLASQAVFVLVARRDRLRQAIAAFGAVAVVGIPFWLTDLVLAGRFDVGVGGGGDKLGGPWAVLTYLWRTAGDFSSGKWPVLIVVLAARARRADPRAARDPSARPLRRRRPRRGLPRRAPRRLHLARVAPPHLRAPVLRRSRRGRHPPQHPPASLGGRRRHRPSRRARGELGVEPDAPALQLGAEQAAGDAGAGGALPRRDEPSRRHPVRVRAALPRRVGAEPRLPRPGRAARRRGSRPAHARPDPKPLGRGIWILDASERNNLQPRLEIENRDPGPAGLFERRVYGPFLILRTRAPLETEDAYLEAAARAMLVGRSLGIGDADVNMQTIERADRSLRGYGPSVRLRSANSR